MRTSVSLSTFKGGPSSPMLFMEELEKNIPLISDLGYDGVDLFVIDPDDEEVRKAVVLLNKYSLGVGVVMPAGLSAMHLTMGDEDKAVRDEFMRRIAKIIGFASEIEAMVSIGLVRGSRREEEPERVFLDRFSESCKKVLDISIKAGVDLVIEPINHYEINTLNSSISALRFIKEYDLPMYLMLDTYHMNIEDRDINESFRLCKDYVRHVHFLDSNRLAPGMGELDMISIYNTLLSIGYDQYLCLEALRYPSGQVVAEKGAEFFKKVGLMR